MNMCTFTALAVLAGLYAVADGREIAASGTRTAHYVFAADAGRLISWWQGSNNSWEWPMIRSEWPVSDMTPQTSIAAVIRKEAYRVYWAADGKIPGYYADAETNMEWRYKEIQAVGVSHNSVIVADGSWNAHYIFAAGDGKIYSWGRSISNAWNMEALQWPVAGMTPRTSIATIIDGYNYAVYWPATDKIEGKYLRFMSLRTGWEWTDTWFSAAGVTPGTRIAASGTRMGHFVFTASQGRVNCWWRGKANGWTWPLSEWHFQVPLMTPRTTIASIAQEYYRNAYFALNDEEIQGLHLPGWKWNPELLPNISLGSTADLHV